MAEVTLATASERQVWENKYYAEYVRASGFLPYMKRSPMGIIHVKYELQEEAGKTINIPLIVRLKGDGVSGSTPLDGAEEELGNFNCAISIDWRRNGVRVPKSTSYKTEIDLWGAGKDMLKIWEAEKLRDDIIYAMMGVVQDVRFQESNEAARDAWLAANSDRVLFGNAISNNSGNDHSASLANCDTTNDKATVASAELAKRIAKNADPHIRPFRTEDGREYFVMFMGSRAFRDIKGDSSMQQANRDARAREGDAMDRNPLFQDGDLIKDGIIYREVPEIDAAAAVSGTNGGLNGVGASSADVRPNFLCGAQAVGIAWGQEPQFQTDLQKDYKFRPGVAIEELLRVNKIFFNSKQHGMVTWYTAAAADS